MSNEKQPTPANGSIETYDAVIIGAGVSGMYALHHLRERRFVAGQAVGVVGPDHVRADAGVARVAARHDGAARGAAQRLHVIRRELDALRRELVQLRRRQHAGRRIGRRDAFRVRRTHRVLVISDVIIAEIISQDE